MKKTELIEELEKIDSIFSMSNEELLNEFDFIEEKDLNGISKYIFLSSIAQLCLARLIKKIDEEDPGAKSINEGGK